MRHPDISRNAPLAPFRDRVAALASDDLLQLVPGDLQVIAEAVERHPSTVQRAIAAQPGTRASAELVAGIEAVVGVPLERIRLVGRVGVGRKRTAAA